MAGLLDELSKLGSTAARAVSPIDPMWVSSIPAIPANARLLNKSIFYPSQVTAKDFTNPELEILRQTALNANQRAGAAPKDAQNWLDTLKTMEDYDKVQSRFSATEGKFIPANQEYEQIIRAITPTMQYPDYPIKTQGYGIGNMPTSASFIDPAYAMSTAIGRAIPQVDQQGNTHVMDTYDFPRGNKMQDYGNWSLPFKAAHYVGENYSNKMPVDINLGLLAKKKVK